MDWQSWGIIAAIVVLLFAIFYKRYAGGFKLGKFSIKKKVVQFATPHRIELILVALFFFFFFLADLAQNKFLDLGMNYHVIFFWNITAPAILLWQVFLIVFQVILLALFLMSLQSKATSRVYDLIVGFVAFFGLALLWSGVVAQIGGSTAYLFGATLRSIDYYHLGVYILMFTGLYYAFTK